jgi:hypothetical protein
MKLPFLNDVEIYWQSPKFFRKAGLFIKINNKRKCLIDLSKY